MWQLFGEGVHPQAERLYETRLAPFLTQSSTAFWNTRLHYFKSGLYFQGGMVRSPPCAPALRVSPAGSQELLLCLEALSLMEVWGGGGRWGKIAAVYALNQLHHASCPPEPVHAELHFQFMATSNRCMGAPAYAWTSLKVMASPYQSILAQGQVVWLFRIILRLVGLGGAAVRLATAPTLDAQRREWEAAWPVRPYHHSPRRTPLKPSNPSGSCAPHIVIFQPHPWRLGP